MATAPEATNESAAKVKTVLNDMPSRSVFDTVAEATAFIEKSSTDLSDFGNFPVVFVGSTDEGDFNHEVYTDSMQVAIVKLTEKGVKTGPNGAALPADQQKDSTVKAIVIYPSPNPVAVIADPAAADWLAGIIAKEANLVAMRPLRKASTAQELTEAQDSMPTTLAEYMTSGRETSSGILETFNQLWQLIKKAMGERYKSFALANLSKKELRKAMESASYAATVYPKLETRTNKAGDADSYFEKAIKLGLALAGAEALDSTIFERMLETRNEKTIDVVDDEDGDDFDFDAIAAKIAAEAKAAESATTEEAPADQNGGIPAPL